MEILLALCFVYFLQLAMASPISQPEEKEEGGEADVWLPALPFKRHLKLQSPALHGKDVVILQNLLRRHDSISSALPATGIFDATTQTAVKTFQEAEFLTQQEGILCPETGKKVIELLMHDGYRDSGVVPTDCKFYLHIPIHRDRNIETMATLYKCDSTVTGMGTVLFTFKVRTRGGTMNGQALNQLTSNGDTPSGLSTLDLNSKEPEKWVKSFGPYPVLRVVKGIKGNAAIGKDNSTGVDGKDAFLSDYRFGILLHTGIWDDWNTGLPMPNSYGCMHAHPQDQKKLVELLEKETGAIVNENPFGTKPYPFKTQGYISIEEIDN